MQSEDTEAIGRGYRQLKGRHETKKV